MEKILLKKNCRYFNSIIIGDDKLKVAIYSRKSRFSEKGESVENQITICKQYAIQNFNVSADDIFVYQDEGFSGKDTNRPEFQKLIKAAKNKEFNILICYRLDRISRNVADFSNTIEMLQKYDIDFISISEQFDTSTPMGRAMMNIAAVFAQLERETIAERIKDNMLELSKSGRWLGGTPPLGFKSCAIEYKNENNKTKKMFKLVNVSDELKIVKLIYKLYIEKRGFNSVANYMCKNRYKGKNGGEFSRSTIEQIIKNPVYCISDEKILNWFQEQGATISGEPDGIHGLMVYNKREGGKKDKPVSEWIISIGKHKGIISSDTWLKCQEIIEQNKAKVAPRSCTGEKFLLSGMIICSECGSHMSSWSHYNKKYDFMERYYRCNLRNRASNRCNNKMLNAYKAEEYVSKYLKEIDIDTLIQKYKNNKSIIEKNDLKTEISTLTNQFEENEKIIKGLIRKMALLNDDIKIIKLLRDEIENIKNDNDKIKIKIKQLTLKLEQTKNHEEFIQIIKDKLNNFKKYFDYVNTESKRLLIKALVDNIIWDGENEVLEINLIGSNKVLPDGVVKRRDI